MDKDIYQPALGDLYSIDEVRANQASLRGRMCELIGGYIAYQDPIILDNLALLIGNFEGALHEPDFQTELALTHEKDGYSKQAPFFYDGQGKILAFGSKNGVPKEVALCGIEGKLIQGLNYERETHITGVVLPLRMPNIERRIKLATELFNAFYAPDVQN